MMIGFEVAPVAPKARFLATSSGSIESSQIFVPLAISERSDEDMMKAPARFVMKS